MCNYVRPFFHPAFLKNSAYAGFKFVAHERPTHASNALISIAPVFRVKNPTLDCFKFTYKPIGPMPATLSLPSVKTCGSCPKGVKEHRIARYKQPNTCLQFFVKVCIT